MRFLEIYLKAYGPFTDHVLGVADGHEGLHVIHGPNEAGKSSALRAIRAFLFGVPERTTDNFLHDHPDLCIGARLLDNEGKEHVLWRRKRRKDALLDENEEPIDERVLSSMLGGIDAPLFERGFGIDHQRLVEGGETLLAGGGDVGESLFAASLGGPGLRDLLKTLDEECETLFKSGRATNPTINHLLQTYRKHVTLVKELSLSPPEWTRQREALEEAEKRLKELDEAWEAGQAKRSRLERLERALPKLAKRAECARELQALEEAGPLPTLKGDFGKERHDAEAARDESRRNVERVQREIEATRSALEGIEVPEALLARQEEIDDLYQQIAGHRKSTEDRLKLESRRQQHEASAKRHLAALRPDLDPANLDAITLSVTGRKGIEQLADLHGGLGSKQDTARRILLKSDQALSRLAAEAEAATGQPDPEPLRKLCEGIRKDGDLETRHADLLAEKQEAEQDAEALLQRLGLWTGPLASADRLPLPDPTTVDRFERTWRDIQDALLDVGRRQEEAEKNLSQLETKLRALERGGAVLTDAELAKAREHREAGWQLVRKAWLDGETVDGDTYDAARPLDQAYEHAVRRADEVGDGLRADAAEVAKKVQFLEGMDEEKARLLKLQEDLLGLQAREKEEQAKWDALWAAAGITPLPPREMRAWIERHARLREALAVVRKVEAEVDAVARRIEHHGQALRSALAALEGAAPPAGVEALAQILDHADAVVARIRGAITAREKREARLVELRETRQEAVDELAAASRDLEEWEARWKTALAPLDLDADTTPEQARAFLGTLHELEQDREKAAELAGRVWGIARDVGLFEESVARLVKELSPTLDGLAAADAIRKLQAEVGAAIRTREHGKRLEQERTKLEAEAAGEQDALDRAVDTLRRLCTDARVENPEELSDVEQRVRAAEDLRERISNIESELLGEGEGASLEELEEQAATVDRDTLGPRILTLADEVKAIDAERQRARIALGETQKTLDDLKPTADAAREAEEAESVASEIRAHAARYVRLRLARSLLQQEMERYRAANQAPLLARATDLFARITCGAFEALEADYDDSDTPVLLGRRKSGQRIGLAGMSDGTREQLYLALRLASLEEHLGKGNAIPLIVDDVLLRSDDERSRAILEALADLSAKTQVLFFTHQSRYVDLAKSLGRDDVFVVPALERDA